MTLTLHCYISAIMKVIFQPRTTQFWNFWIITSKLKSHTLKVIGFPELKLLLTLLIDLPPDHVP